MVAWIMGSQPLVETGFQIIGAHTDSPNLRLKPNPVQKNYGYHQLGVEEYGGVLLSSWMDRDLSIAGRVIFQNPTGTSLLSQLVQLKSPLVRIPLLAIHLDRDVNEKGLVLNRQLHLSPILGLVDPSDSNNPLYKVLSDALKIKEEQIVGHDLSLFDVQPATLLGLKNEWMTGARLDNLYSCFAAIEALVAIQSHRLSSTSMVACFDHEEIGSVSTQGARSFFLQNLVERLIESQSHHHPAQAYGRAMSQSLFVSLDMAHALHPNYPEKHEPRHFPLINQGPVIKSNSQGRYASHGLSSARFEAICQKQQIPYQKFINRSDLGCGSTIGPFVASTLGIPAVDVGSALLSMHSIREVAGTHDLDQLIQALEGVFQWGHRL